MFPSAGLFIIFTILRKKAPLIYIFKLLKKNYQADANDKKRR